MTKQFRLLIVLFLVLSLVVPVVKPAGRALAAPANPVTFTILHTNDFHGQLQASGSNPGLARVATQVNTVRTEMGDGNVLVVDVGDEMQGSLLSNIWDGEPTIAAFNELGYDVATFGNHEFDWGQTVLGDRTTQAEYPYVTANIVVNDTGNCATAGWTAPAFADAPYQIFTVGTAPDAVTIAFIGVTSTETPTITIAEATEGLCFKDPAESILHYYDEMNAAADVIVVLSHLGYTDGGYGYGIPVYGDQTLAARLNTAGKPVDLILGGHSHTNMAPPATVVGTTTIAHAYYNGRTVGRADITVQPSGAVSVAWSRYTPLTALAEEPNVKAVIDTYANDPAYLALINQPIGYVQTDLLRNYNGDSMMGDFVDDAIYNWLNTDTDPTNDVDMFFNNAGGIRTDWCDAPDPANPGQYIWSSAPADCQPGVWAHDPMLLTYGQMFTILPFGNATIVGEMTGAQILQLLNQSATLFKGAIQPAGMRYSFYRYADALPGPQPWAWGAFDACVLDKATPDPDDCVELEMDKVYKVGTNEFLAPAGQDGYLPFKYMTNITYWGDMLDAVNAYVGTTYGTMANPYKGPNGDGTLDGRITRDGTDASGSIVPLTILHHNDSHGNLVKGRYVGYTQLATLIQQERAHNPDRTLLLSGGDNIQGDAMMYYFKSAGLGYAADGTALPADLQINPLVKAFNFIGYDAMTLGNHEFNFGSQIFRTLAQAEFPILGANVADTGEYGLEEVGVEPFIEKTLDGINVAILGITNHRVPNYELPSNIPGLTFYNPIEVATDYAPALKANNDVVIALTHIGFTEDPRSVEVDENVDTNFAMQVPGVDTIIGSHSHTNPATGYGDYKFLPTIIGGPDNTPVIVNQAYRYNNTLGEVIIGLKPDGAGGYEIASRAGQYITVSSSTVEDPAIVDIVAPYVSLLNAYNDTELGETTVPIDALKAYTEETNGANMQADASVAELESNGIEVDFHLSGAMSNRIVAEGATPESPVMLKVSDMFTLMPYENSLVVMEMNGPQLKAVLERAYRNYYYYKYVPGYGGYSYYTTCMLTTDAGNKITYNDINDAPYDPAMNYVISLEVDGHEIDFTDADTYYRVSTVNYLAAGSCNFNNAGVSLWPLDQITNDTQYYVRDAVINYVKAMGTVSPAIEGRLNFIYDLDAPVITINSPMATTYMHSELLPMDFTAEDVGPAGVKAVWGNLDGMTVHSGDVVDLHSLSLGSHTLTVYAVDKAGNASEASVTFQIETSVDSLIASVQRFYMEGKITNHGVLQALVTKLEETIKGFAKNNSKAPVNTLQAFINLVEAQYGKSITPEAADLLISDAMWLIEQLQQ